MMKMIGADCVRSDGVDFAENVRYSLENQTLSTQFGARGASSISDWQSTHLLRSICAQFFDARAFYLNLNFSRHFFFQRLRHPQP